jgi:manganese/iron transport system permease protein/iron/zinc/copper transport system permease protein
MSVLLDALAGPLHETYFQKSLIGAGIVAVVAGVVGCLVILRRMAFLGDALSHAMIAGVAAGYLVMKMVFGLEANAPGMLLGSLLAALLTAGLIGFVSRVTRIKEDTAIGIMYTGVFALGVVVVSIFRHYIHIDLMHFIMGDVLGISDTDLWVSAWVAAAVLSLIILFFRHFQMAAFDPVMAASIGLPIVLLDYLLTMSVSLVVVSAVSMVGVILVVGLLITPAATAYLLCDRLSRMMVLSALFGVSSVLGGLYACVWLDTAGGGAILVFATLQFLVVLISAPRYGLIARWLRQRRAVPEQVLEDILGILIRRAGEPVGIGTMRDYMPDTRKLKASLHNLVRGDLIARDAGGYLLTRKGAEEANRILRAHRLWETYLVHIGAPEGDLHQRAHILEHISDSRSMDYLDRVLGFPARDPMGKEIPPKKDAK